MHFGSARIIGRVDIETHSLLTTTPNALVAIGNAMNAEIHNMPIAMSSRA
jgi:hypothetical protein